MANPVLQKDPADNRNFDMNFGEQPELIAGDTISSWTVVATAITVGNPALPTIGSPTVTGPRVFVTIAGGVDQNDYDVKFTALTAAGRTIVLSGTLQVRLL